MIETTDLVHRDVSIKATSDRYPDRLCWLLWYRRCGDTAISPVYGIGQLGWLPLHRYKQYQYAYEYDRSLVSYTVAIGRIIGWHPNRMHVADTGYYVFHYESTASAYEFIHGIHPLLPFGWRFVWSTRVIVPNFVDPRYYYFVQDSSFYSWLELPLQLNYDSARSCLSAKSWAEVAAMPHQLRALGLISLLPDCLR